MSFVLSVTIVQGSILEASTGKTSDISGLNARVVDNYGKLPVRFEQNDGQTHQGYNYVARGQGYTMFLKPDGIVMALIPSVEKTAHHNINHKDTKLAKKHKVDVVNIKFAGTGASRRVKEPGASWSVKENVKLPELTALDELEGKSNYLIGNSEEKWLSNVTAYKRIKYTGLYPGIDLVLYGNQKEIEYDFIVQPMADLRKIALKINGAMSIKINNNGDIALKTHGGEILMRKPKIYQEIDGMQKPVNGTYVIKNKHLISFKVDDYNKKLPLIIDPVMQYSTYLGGSSGDQALAIAVDTLGNAYVTGKTISLDFPIVNQYHNSYNGDYYDVFVSKFSKDGSSLIYSTYIGGSRDDEARSIAVETNGSAYITGSTYSQDFPIVNPFQTSLHGWVDAFVTKLSPNGTSLMYSTYFGGTDNDEANAIAIDSGGNAYITGYTYSTDFPVNNAYQSEIAGINDAYVTKFSASGTYIPYSTYLGGEAEDETTGIAVDANGNVYITGFTSSTQTFPRINALQPTHWGGTYDSFVAKLDSFGSPYFSTYVGGNGSDRAKGIAVDTNNNLYIVGSTTSTNFPPAITAIQGALKGMTDAFVAKLDSSGQTLNYWKYLGGSDIDIANAIAVHKNGNIYIAGETASTDFPTLTPYKKTNSGYYDAFMARLISDNSTTLQFSTYLGGSADDKATAIAVDQREDAYLCGYTASANFPTVRPLQGTFTPPAKDTDLAIDAFVVQLRFKRYRSDFNADGMSDILWQNDKNGQLYVWLINGTKFYSGDSPAILDDLNWQYKGTGDFNADRMSDVLWQNISTGQLVIWFMDGAKIQSIGILATLGDQSWKIKGLADFDGDGNTDILWQNSSSGEVGIWFIDGTRIVSTTSLGTVNSEWNIKGTDDFSGDGKADVLWQNTSTGQLVIWLMDGANISSIGNVATVAGSPWQFRGATADFNGDGRSDILWQDSKSGQFFIWLIDGATIINGVNLPAMTDPNWQLKAVTDFNNDNKADMLWFNSSTGELYIWIIDGASISNTESGSPGTVGAASSWKIKTDIP
ncbi:PKD domain containing protein [Candidatus Magnetobacterium bavaricum]|uniref:PKD domain containing protein n=1 Tax=Candidatus Magnetobacterium bavaricum TaxID=29290 RepID=A0A0F3GZT9_9BACT|nr:PKD domain containing protein [Candidatus Magnetobacterium bavaricum]